MERTIEISTKINKYICSLKDKSIAYVQDNEKKINEKEIMSKVYFNAITEKGKKYAILYTNRGKIYIDKYVHQLQHALRLCGIEKEIIL